MKRIRKYAIILLALAAMVCSVVALAACGDNAKLSEISVENAETMFRIGDEFTFGEDFKVYAVYSDETKVDITLDPELSIKKESGFDMNVPGDYQITVSYKKKVYVYTIYVSDFDPILRKIDAETDGVKKSYELGEEISLDGLKLTLTYENAQGELFTSVASNLRNFNVEISNGKGVTLEQTDAFPTLGTFTVTISKGTVKTSFTVEVDGVNLSSVQSAVAVAKAFQSEVLSGTLSVKQSSKVSSTTYEMYRYEYTFGNNYLHTKESIETKEDCHYSMDGEGIFCIREQSGLISPVTEVPEKAIEGVPILLWYMSVKEFGIENALNNLYEAAKVCTNKDFTTNKADPETREYDFSFSGLVFRSSNADFYKTDVIFKLGENYNVESATITQKYYENNQAKVEAGQATPTFVTDAETGITTPTGGYSAEDVITVTQVAGERTQTNPYSRDMFRVQSYNLVYNGQVLGDDGVIECSMQDESLKLSIENVSPSTANFSQDLLYLDYEGNYGQKDANSVQCTGFYARNNWGRTIDVSLRNGGVWKLILTTANTRKTVTFKVTGIPPTSMTAKLLNESSGLFYSASSKALAVNGKVTFYGMVNQYANESQKAQITSANKNNATLDETTVNGVNCFRFSASAAGTYTVKVTSTVANVSTTFTFTVNETPDYSSLLNGKYTAENFEGVFELVFTPSGNEGDTSGTLTITLDDGEAKKTEECTYAADESGEKVVVLTHVSGERLGVDLVMKNGVFMLEDRKGTTNPLVRVTE